jgi:hypothetical protein
LRSFPSPREPLRTAEIRFIEKFEVAEAFHKLVELLQSETNQVKQFQIALTLSKLEAGWTEQYSGKLIEWLISNQSGWFSDTSEKGVEFPEYWATVLQGLARTHSAKLLANFGRIDLGTPLGRAALEEFVKTPNAQETLISLVKKTENEAALRNIILASKPVLNEPLSLVLLEKLNTAADSQLVNAIISTLASGEIPRNKIPEHGAAKNLVLVLDQKTRWAEANKVLAGLTETSLEKTNQASAIAYWRNWFKGMFATEASTESERPDEAIYNTLVKTKMGSSLKEELRQGGRGDSLALICRE